MTSLWKDRSLLRNYDRLVLALPYEIFTEFLCAPYAQSIKIDF